MGNDPDYAMRTVREEADSQRNLMITKSLTSFEMKIIWTMITDDDIFADEIYEKEICKRC